MLLNGIIFYEDDSRVLERYRLYRSEEWDFNIYQMQYFFIFIYIYVDCKLTISSFSF